MSTRQPKFSLTITATLSLLLAASGSSGTLPAIADEFTPGKPAVVIQDADVAASPDMVIQVPVMPTPPAGTEAPMPMPGQPGATPAATPDGQASVKRPPAEKYVPQPIDSEIRLNPDGKVSFSLSGQPWEVVLQWLSDASALSLDWQELPADSLNLITTRDYTMEEARDLINRHLLSRGFTMIVSGELMSIVKTKELNPALVRRVTPEQLATLPDHTICKVSFNLDWLIADEAVEELKPMLSSAGQIHKLSRTNRLEVIDTAISLRQIWELIEAEQSVEGEEQLVKAIRLKHRRAEDVIRMLRELLKLQDPGGSGGNGGGMDPNMGMQIMQQMQQMQQQMQQAAGQASPGAGGKGKTTETRLVLNQRENMILAQAAPDQMALILKAVEQIDVPTDSTGSLLQNINRMKIYRLESVDPQTLADLLQQLGDLDPGTTLKVDKSKRSIIAWATIADHLTISTLVERLDQSARKIEVIPLRRLDAEYVAGTIRLLMGNVEEKDENPFAQRYGYFDFNQMNPQTPKEPSFKVEADTDNNRLLINANTIEMEEIRELLIKLGELPDPNAANDGIRIFDLSPDEDLQRFRQQLEQYWRRGNQLEFDLPDTSVPDVDPTEEQPIETERPTRLKSAPKAAEPKATDSNAQTLSQPRVRVWPMRTANGRKASGSQQTAGSRLDALLEADRSEKTISINGQAPVLTRLMEDESAPSEQSSSADENAVPQGSAAEGSSEADASQGQDPVISRELIRKLRGQISEQDEKPNVVPREITDALEEGGRTQRESSPVRISMTPDGKLIVSSNDPQALADMEELIAQVASPRRSFKVFRLKYATPSWVTLNLKDFFKADQETKSSLEYNPYWGIMPTEKKVTGNRSLSKRRQPQFIYDNFTSTILVRDADLKQLQTIEDLIAIYDVPEPSDARSMRVTTIFRLEHARAASVAAAVKDVFRDLLSSNDKALEKDDKNQQRQSSGGLVTFLPGGGKKEGEDEEEPIRFKGLLSIGIDDSSNTLIVSSAGTLMDTIGEMIEALDEAADSTSVVQVVKVDKTVDLALIQERLRELMKLPAPPQGQQPGQPGQPQPGQPGFPGAQPGINADVAVPGQE